MSDKVTRAYDDFEMRALLARERLDKWDFQNGYHAGPFNYGQLVVILKDVIKASERFVHLRDKQETTPADPLPFADFYDDEIDRLRENTTIDPVQSECVGAKKGSKSQRPTEVVVQGKVPKRRVSKERTGKEVLEEAIHKQQARAIVALQKFKDENGRLPTWEEWENPSTRPDYAPSTATMIKCFGTWEEVALRAAEL